MEMVDDSPKLRHMTVWERELNLEFDLQDWEANWQNMRKCTNSLTIRETAIKLFTRWYYTPSRLHTIYPQASSSCFCGCALPGSILGV